MRNICRSGRNAQGVHFRILCILQELRSKVTCRLGIQSALGMRYEVALVADESTLLDTTETHSADYGYTMTSVKLFSSWATAGDSRLPNVVLTKV